MSRAGVQFPDLPPYVFVESVRSEVEEMTKRDAEIAVAMQIYNENLGQMTNEQAMVLGEEFVRIGTRLIVSVTKGQRKVVFSNEAKPQYKYCED